jgi:hypothetical protein
MTLNQVVKRLETLALGHKQINSFREGDLVDVLNERDIDYPICLVQILPGSISRTSKQTNFNFAIYFMDLVNVSNNAKSNELEVQSDLTSIAEDIMALITYPDYLDTWTPSNEAQLEYFNEKFEDLVTAARITLTISTRFDANRCQVPTTQNFE